MFPVRNNADFIDSPVDCQDLILRHNRVTPALVNIRPGLPVLLGYSVIGYQVMRAVKEPWQECRRGLWESKKVCSVFCRREALKAAWLLLEKR